MPEQILKQVERQSGEVLRGGSHALGEPRDLAGMLDGQMSVVPESQGVAAAAFRCDTCRGSLLHALAPWTRDESRSTVRALALAYVVIAVLSYGSLLASVLVFEPACFTGAGTTSVDLAFAYDWSTMCQLLLTFPLMTVLLLSERQLVPGRFRKLLTTGSLVDGKGASTRFRDDWEGFFGRVNIGAQVIAGVVGVVVTIANYELYASWSSWQAVGGRFGVPGVLWLFWIFVFYFVASYYVLRATAFCFLLHSATNRFSVKLLSFHPDGCGGLRPIADLGLRNQYLLAAAGANLVLLYSVTRSFPHKAIFDALLLAAVLLYVCGGPIAFLGPLLPFRKAMAAAKEKLIDTVSGAVQAQYAKCIDEVSRHRLEKEDYDAVERLRKILDRVNQLPVWPFDIHTLKRFVGAYVVPVVPLVASHFLGDLPAIATGLLNALAGSVTG